MSVQPIREYDGQQVCIIRARYTLHMVHVKAYRKKNRFSVGFLTWRGICISRKFQNHNNHNNNNNTIGLEQDSKRSRGFSVAARPAAETAIYTAVIITRTLYASRATRRAVISVHTFSRGRRAVRARVITERLFILLRHEFQLIFEQITRQVRDDPCCAQIQCARRDDNRLKRATIILVW